MLESMHDQDYVSTVPTGLIYLAMIVVGFLIVRGALRVIAGWHAETKEETKLSSNTVGFWMFIGCAILVLIVVVALVIMDANTPPEKRGRQLTPAEAKTRQQARYGIR